VNIIEKQMKKTILLSIKPNIIREIISGEKKFEFRKQFPNLDSEDIGRKIIIYSSTPQMSIMGSFTVGRYLHSDFDTLMSDIDSTPEYKKRISKYFGKNQESCHALEITNLNIYETPLSLRYLREKFNNFFPGQSYRYLPDEIIEDIKSKNKSY